MRYQDAWLEEVNYMNDRRVQARNLWSGYSDSGNVITKKINAEFYEGDDERFPQLVHLNEEDHEKSTCILMEDFPIDFPSKFEVCWICDGKGKHTNPSIDASGISREDFDEDPDFREDYFSGIYDITCGQCHGKRVVPVVDTESQLMEKEIEIPISTYSGEETGEVAKVKLSDLYEMVLSQEEEEEHYRQDCLSERRMGA